MLREKLKLNKAEKAFWGNPAKPNYERPTLIDELIEIILGMLQNNPADRFSARTALDKVEAYWTKVSDLLAELEANATP